MRAIGGIACGFAAAIACATTELTSACNLCTNVCADPYSVDADCLIGSAQCLVNGAPIPKCVPGDCAPFGVDVGGTLSIPVGTMWATLGSRDDLHIGCNCVGMSPPDASDSPGGITVSVDGVDFKGCSIPPLGPLICANIPRTARTIQIHFANGAPELALDFWDDECAAAHPVCPE